jgi:hypothetical protein
MTRIVHVDRKGRGEPQLRPAPAAALTDLLNELELGGRRSRAAAERHAKEESARRRRAKRALWALIPFVAASSLFHAASGRLLGIAAPGAEERRARLRAELELAVEEIDAYLVDNGALVANLSAIDSSYDHGYRFEALSDRRYRLVIRRGGESVAYDSDDATERAR